jgi:hypothetical protein
MPIEPAYADAALFLAWPAGIAATALVVFLGRRAWPVALAYAATAGAVIVAYPAIRGALLARLYTAAELAAVLVAVGCGLTWYRGSSNERTTTAQASMSLTAAVELGTIAFSWRADIFASWHLSQVAYLLLFAVLILLQGGYVWMR